MSLTKHQKQYLVTGYIRCNTNNNPNIPIVTSEECYLFYEETFEWSFETEILTQFINANNGKSFVSLKIKYHDFTFICIVYPNGIDRDDEGFITIDIKLVTKPNDIHRVNTFCDIYLENKLICKEPMKFDLHHKLCRLTNSSLCDLKLSQYKDLKSLLFLINIQIISIDYHQEGEDERFDVGKWFDYSKYCQPFTIDQYTKYEWKLNDLILREIRKNNNKIFYFQDNINWIMTLKSNWNDPQLCLYLIKLPYQINAMNIRCKLTIKYDNDEDIVKIIDVKSVDLSNKIIFHYSDWKSIESINGLAFICEIYVLKVVDVNGHIIFNDNQQQERFFTEFINC